MRGAQGVPAGSAALAASSCWQGIEKKGLVMKRVALPFLIVAGLTASALAADMATKAPPAPPAPPPSPWDVAITAAVMNDYNFRGITQSRHPPSVQGGFEVRYTVSPMWQYFG